MRKCCFMGFPSARAVVHISAEPLHTGSRQPMTILLYDLVGADAARPFSPHCWKIAFALAHKGLDFERVPTPFTAVAGSRAVPIARVPVIRDGRRVVVDSFADRALSRRDLSRPADALRRRGRQGARPLRGALELTIVHPFLGTRGADGHPRQARPGRPAAFPHHAREARFGRALEEVPEGREERSGGLPRRRSRRCG